MHLIDADRLKELVNADINRCYMLRIGSVGPLSHFLDQIDSLPSISLDEIAEAVDEKMTYMCGCRNCIENVKMIIKNDVKPFASHCTTCSVQNCWVNKEEN